MRASEDYFALVYALSEKYGNFSKNNKIMIKIWLEIAGLRENSDSLTGISEVNEKLWTVLKIKFQYFTYKT